MMWVTKVSLPPLAIHGRTLKHLEGFEFSQRLIGPGTGGYLCAHLGQLARTFENDEGQGLLWDSGGFSGFVLKDSL
jgi:hypothetical protein